MNEDWKKFVFLDELKLTPNDSFITILIDTHKLKIFDLLCNDKSSKEDSLNLSLKISDTTKESNTNKKENSKKLKNNPQSLKNESSGEKHTCFEFFGCDNQKNEVKITNLNSYETILKE